jgi:hypothetical protein
VTDIVTSSGFVFERRGSRVVLLGCRRSLVALAELEYLREVEPRGAGRIVEVARRSADGRELHAVRVDVPGEGARVVTFDVGDALVGKLRVVHEALGFLVYGIAGLTALGTLGFLVLQCLG